MQNVSADYINILAGSHWFECSITVDGRNSIVTESDLFSVVISHKLFDTTPQIGTAVAAEIEIKMIDPSFTIPTMAKIQPYVRACNETQQSEWIRQGVFYVDTRERTKDDTGLSILTIHGYDGMLKAEQMFDGGNTITGDSTDTSMLDYIASKIGTSVDSRTYTIMNKAYTVPLPTGYTYREILGYIASMYAGCFIMTEEGKLRLVALYDIPPETNYLIDNVGNAITFGGDRILV